MARPTSPGATISPASLIIPRPATGSRRDTPCKAGQTGEISSPSTSSFMGEHHPEAISRTARKQASRRRLFDDLRVPIGEPRWARTNVVLSLCAAVLLAGCAGYPTSNAAQNLPSGHSGTGDVGPPVSAVRSPAGAGEPPSDEELDRRDRMLSGPRLPAGPPLPESMPGREAGAVVPVPSSTDPRGR